MSTTTSLPTRVSEWQLYRGMPKTTEAARKLTSALRKAEREVRKGLKKVHTTKDAEKVLGEVFYRVVYPVMSTYADVGAADTEPRNVGQGYLEKVAHEYGFYGYLNF